MMEEERKILYLKLQPKTLFVFNMARASNAMPVLS